MSEPRTPGEPIDRLRERVLATRDAAWAAANAGTWVCSDGHHHPRPATFTHRRLTDEVNRRNPGNDWSSSEISLGVYRLKDEGLLIDDGRWNLSLRGSESEPKTGGHE